VDIELPLETTPPPGSPLYSGVTKPVVELSLLVVAQYLVGLGGFLELLLCLGIAGVAIRVELEGQLTVGLLDLIGGGLLLHSEDFVVVALGH
jgi:hypothetical protein